MGPLRQKHGCSTKLGKSGSSSHLVGSLAAPKKRSSAITPMKLRVF